MRIGVTASAVGHWERPGGSRPSSENLAEIAKELSVSLEWLALGRGEMRPGATIDPDPPINPLRDDEQELLSQYRELPAQARMLLSQFLKGLRISVGPVGEAVSTRERGRRQAL